MEQITTPVKSSTITQVNAIPVKTFQKEVLEQFRLFIEKESVRKIVLSVNKSNKVAIFKCKCDGNKNLTVVVIGMSLDKLKLDRQDRRNRMQLVLYLHMRRVKQQHMAILLGVSQPLISKIVNRIGTGSWLGNEDNEN